MEDTEQTHNALKRHVDDSDNDNNDTTHDSPSPSSNNSNNESSSKKPRVDHTEDHSADEEGDHTNADKDSTAEVTSRNVESAEPVSEARDPQTGLTESQTKALERAKQYAREVQEELVKAGALTSATEPEPSLAIANISEQRKSLCRIYVGSISFEATEDDVRQKLSRFGAIKELALK
ncbi:hypothetical protein BGZ91_005066, partial [Linnemannia elongata]